MKKFYTLLLICAAGTGYSQQGFGTSNPAPSSVIDMVASNKGALLPRVTLTSTAVAAPVPSPANALTVFNTATTGDVTPGYYYWSSADSKWIRLTDANTPITEVDGVIGNEVTNATTNGGLTRAGAGTNVNPYTLGLTSGTANGDLMTWNGTSWIPSAAATNNIYNTDGTLTSNRTLTIGGKSLHFLGSDQLTQWGNFGYFYQMGLASSAFGNASMAFLAADKDGNGKNSRMDIQTFPEAEAQITANGDATGLVLETSTTINSAPITFATSAGGNALGTEKMRITGEGNVAINNSTPTEVFHVSGNTRIENLPLNGSTNAIFTTPDGDASSSQDQTFTATKTVVADANGVLGSITGVPLTAEVDGGIGNEVTDATTNGGLTRTGAGTSVSPYTLGLTSGTAAGQLMTWNGTAWAPAAAVNIYNANGSLTSARTLTHNGFNLTFLGTNQSAAFSPTTGFTQRGLASTKRASVTLQSDDNNSDGVVSSMFLFQDPENVSQIKASNDSRGLSIGSSSTTQEAPIIFATSAGSSALGTEKMRITGSGNVGISTVTPTEKLDNNGITRLRTLPLNGATNAINTTPSGTLSSAQDQTFTATRTVVADANGVLGYVTTLPSDTGTTRVLVNVSVPGTQNLINAFSPPVTGQFTNESIDTYNAWSSNVFTVPTGLGGLYSIVMQNSSTHTSTGTATPTWSTIAFYEKSTDGGTNWSELMRHTYSNLAGTIVDNGNILYWTGFLNTGDQLRVRLNCNSTTNNIVINGGLTITKIAQ